MEEGKGRKNKEQCNKYSVRLDTMLLNIHKILKTFFQPDDFPPINYLTL